MLLYHFFKPTHLEDEVHDDVSRWVSIRTETRDLCGTHENFQTPGYLQETSDLG